MGFNYSGDPSNSNLDAVRFLIGDTTSPGDLQDAEIIYLVAAYATVGLAALAATRTLVSKFATTVDKSVGDLKISASQKFKHYLALIPVMEELIAADNPVGVYLGGLVQSEEDSDDADSTITHPRMKVGMHDYDGGTSVDPLRSDV